MQSKLSPNEHTILALATQYGITNKLEQACMLAQFAFETGNFAHFSENPRYRYGAALSVFPKYTPQIKALQATNKAASTDFVKQPDFFNIVYGGRMGNQLNGTADNDGYDYRGGGYVHLTGRENYQDLLDWLHSKGQQLQLTIDTVDDWVRGTAEGAAISAIWFWLDKKCGVPAQKGDVRALTKIVNGGGNGLAGRIKLTAYYRSVLGC